MVWSYRTTIVVTLCKKNFYGIWQAIYLNKNFGLRKRSTWYLPWYYVDQQGFLICNTLCVMHCEKNITESLKKTLIGEKDSRKTQGSHGLKGSQHTAVIVAHTGEKTKKFDFATSFVCAHKKKERGIRGCCAAVENSNSLCWPIAKNSSHGWKPERIEIQRLPCLYATSFAPLCTHNHEKKNSIYV